MLSQPTCETKSVKHTNRMHVPAALPWRHMRQGRAHLCVLTQGHAFRSCRLRGRKNSRSLVNFSLPSARTQNLLQMLFSDRRPILSVLALYWYGVPSSVRFFFFSLRESYAVKHIPRQQANIVGPSVSTRLFLCLTLLFEKRAKRGDAWQDVARTCAALV